MAQNPFAAALAKKAQSVQAEREKTEARKQFARDMGNAYSQQTPEARAGAQATAIMTAFNSMPTPDPVPVVNNFDSQIVYDDSGPTVTIERVLDRNRIDVYFTQKPSDRILDTLRNAGFRFRPSDKAWYHADTEKNRFILSDLLGANFCEENAKDVMAHESTAGVPIQKEDDPAWTVPEVSSTPEFERYRQQVDELLEHLKVRPADLMLIAIDVLHKQTFSTH